MRIETSTINYQSDLLSQETSVSGSPQKAVKRYAYKSIAEHLCCDLNGEMVILSLSNGKYYGINAVGSRVWELLVDFVALPEIEQTILEEYAVDEEVCRREVGAFLESMIAEGLIETRDESSGQIF